MKYFSLTATAQCAGLEWMQHAVIERKTLNDDLAQEACEDLFGHDGEDIIELHRWQELTKDEYKIMKKYL